MNQDDLNRYLEKSGDDKIIPTNLVENEHGFASFWINNNELNIINVYGDGKYWDAFFTQIAEETGCNKMRMATRRNPKAFERKFGFKQVGVIMEKEVKHE